MCGAAELGFGTGGGMLFIGLRRIGKLFTKFDCWKVVLPAIGSDGLPIDGF